MRMPAHWKDSADTLPALNPRIAFRDVVHATNPRKVWAALLPSKTLLTNPAPYLVFARGDMRAQAYVLGMLNSSACDWFGHSRIGLHLNFFIFKCLPIPIYEKDDPLAERLIDLAASLALEGRQGDYGAWAGLVPNSITVDISERVAELDAIATLLYGVSDELLEVIFKTPTRPKLSEIRRHRNLWQRDGGKSERLTISRSSP